MQYRAYLLEGLKGARGLEGAYTLASLHWCLAKYEYEYGNPDEIRVNPGTSWDKPPDIALTDDERIGKGMVYLGPLEEK